MFLTYKKLSLETISRMEETLVNKKKNMEHTDIQSTMLEW